MPRRDRGQTLRPNQARWEPSSSKIGACRRIGRLASKTLRTFSNGQLFGEFLSARLAADLLQHLARGPRQLEDGLDKVFGDARDAIIHFFALRHRSTPKLLSRRNPHVLDNDTG